MNLSLGTIQDIVKTGFNFNEKINLLQFIVNDLKLKEVTVFVKENNLNDKTIRNKIKANNPHYPNIFISNTRFILTKYININK